jgi:hypothetical protein
VMVTSSLGAASVGVAASGALVGSAGALVGSAGAGVALGPHPLSTTLKTNIRVANTSTILLVLIF